MTVLRSASRVAGFVVPMSQLARLGLPAFVALLALVALLIIGIFWYVCWVTSSEDRSDRLARLLTAARGGAEAQAPAPAASDPARALPWFHRR